MKHVILFSILCVPFFAFAQKIQLDNGVELEKRNVFSVLVNTDDQLLVQGEAMEVSEIRATAKRFVLNPSHVENMSEFPERAVFLLEKENDACSEFYSTVLNELKKAYDDIWNQIAIERYGIGLEYLNDDIQRAIREDYPMVIVEQ